MIKGEKVRLDIHKILYSVYKLNSTLKDQNIKKIINMHKREDLSLLHNVTLNSMRFHLHTSKIINKYIKKKIRDQEKILLMSAITQIVFLEFKEYAVINCSVEIAKKLKIYHGFINACLKKINNDKKELKKIEIKYNDFPVWFKKHTTYLSEKEKEKFLKNFNKEPSLHVVFKNEKKLIKFEESLVKTSDVSGFLVIKKDIKTIQSFRQGDWWVQDFSSFFTLNNFLIKSNNKKYLDACAAPGGKAFQLLSKKCNTTLNDKNIARIKTLKSNLNRLNYKAKILNRDFINFKEDEKYDFIIIDAPCSAVGTIRKNPEIFFKKKGPNFKALVSLQENMLRKASLLLNKDGFILYMVCSFLKNETENQINKFLISQTNFQLYNFELTKKNMVYSKILNNNFVFTLPDTILNHTIDGYFAAFLKKIK